MARQAFCQDNPWAQLVNWERSSLCLGLLAMLVRCPQRAEEPIADGQVVSIVVLVGCVVDKVVACAHNGLAPPVDAIVDVRGPHRSREQQQLVRQEVHGHQRECPHVRDRLEHPI
eukprot:1183953-Prorocentrum_minimum.AAC.4